MDGFIGQQSLVFAHTLKSWRRVDNHNAEVSAVLRNGFEGYPANDISIQYRLKKMADGWHIISHELK